MRLYYHDTPRPGNFGDILNKWLVEEISGRKVVKSPPANNVHICIGSIIKYASDKMHVWGTGAMWEHDKPSPTAYYHAVRGPLTRDVVLRNGGDCPEIYGDPALLLPQFFNPEVPKKYKLGIIPHYVDYKAVKQAFPKHKVINLINADPLAVVKEILQCEEIVSSSLHGIIAAQAYGVPAAWVQTIEGKLSGDGTKFRDYFLSTNQEIYTPYELKDLDNIPKSADIEIDLKKLLHAAPFFKGQMPLVVSFYTEDYARHAKRLTEELKKLKLDHHIVKLDPIGEWIDNTRLKGELVLNTLKRNKRSVLWVDADSSVHKEPKLLNLIDADFAAWAKTGERPWAVGHLWFNYTPKGIELCEKWAKYCKEAPQGVSDEWALEKAWQEVKDVKSFNLPRDYFASNITPTTVLSYRLSGNAQNYLKGK
jgi:hypothetical protein